MKINKIKRILASYLICLTILLVGWYFFLQYERKTRVDEYLINEIEKQIEKQTNFFVNFNIEDQFLDNFREPLTNVFQNPKLASFRFFKINIFLNS